MKTASPRLYEYCIDVGDSYKGPVGLVCYVKAPNRREALKAFRTWYKVDYPVVESRDKIELRLYVNPQNVKLSDVRRSEDDVLPSLRRFMACTAFRR